MNESSLMSLLILFIVFLICREIMCWYWKMNEVLKVLNKILLHLNPKANDTPMGYTEYKKGGK